ncbi:MAG: aldehyde dehydrogenase [Crocinitomicaceae bacterium]|nr:aldehyde dehydrogenase [Crocinitomicaceae bacterium]MDP4869171.1 aldehyde dehydrogenase [Crocinitomicaceae bacterium]
MHFSDLLANQRQYFKAQHTKTLAARKSALQRFKQMLLANEAQLYAAVHADFQKSEHEAFLTEWAILIKDIDEALGALPKWMKAQKVSTNLVNLPGKSYVVPEPLGVCLVIGAWNYPVQLSFAPVIAALAAGNTVILKPSELAANSAQCMADIVANYFDPQLFTVVLGGVAETTALLEQRFDKIFFTGSPAVGRIVYQAAAKHLTPVTLELGGKSPAILTPSADLPTAIKRLVWAKFLNAGQTCIAPDYVFVHESIYRECLNLFQQEIEKNQYALANKNYVQIINERNLARLENLLDKDKIAFGGAINHADRTISPTLLKDVGFDDAIMQEEIFGPILPLLPYTDFQEALAYIQDHEKPLSAYLFCNNKTEQAAWLSHLSFGGGCINDAIMHITNPNLPFGGVGQSGTGSYHGKSGFDTFSHRKSVFEKPRLFEVPLKYPPYTASKMNWIKRLLKFS